MKSFPTDLQVYVHSSRYARWREEDGRRETWPETVNRYTQFFYNRDPVNFPTQRIYDAIVNLETMPSMRCLITAGPALEESHIAGYNCSYLPIDSTRAFDELMYILMCGTGVGFSVEEQYVKRLPTVPEEFSATNTVIDVPDSRIGWAKSFRELLAMLWAGQVPKWDVSKVRPKGARLKTFGGRASGPEPLVDLFKFAVTLFKTAAGRKLTSLECHDLACKVADIVVVGGVRRSALISLSDLNDNRVRQAKNGKWWELNPERALANNSAVYTEKPDMGTFFWEWHSLYTSRSGERGIVNRASMQKQAARNGRRDAEYDFGTNPCGEILLRPNGLCNLSEVIVRSTDTLEDLLRKVENAAIIGTFQSTLTNFKYVRSIWRRNAEEERLLGVSLTGIMDHPVLSGRQGTEELRTWLEAMRQRAVDTNAEWAARIGISPSTAITTVKPSGTVSQLVDSSSGIHPRYSRYYIRTVRADKTDPLAQFMRAKGFPVQDDVTKPLVTDVFAFPVRAPDNAVFRDDMTAIGQLEHYLVYKQAWCEHNPSITVYVREHEWMGVGDWVFQHFDDIGGVSFLPHTEHAYKQAPYTEITEEEYELMAAAMPQVDWEELVNYETGEDSANNVRDMACSAGSCEIL